MRYSFKHFQELYPNDDACLDKIFQDRFGDLNACPKCGVVNAKFYKVKKRQCYACEWCGYQLHPLANTIFRKSHVPLTDWFYVIFQFSTSKNGVAATKIQRDLGISYKSAWRMCKQVRLLMKQDLEQLSGEVEVDETYAPSRRHARIIGRSKKQIIFGAVERYGRVNASHVKSAGVRIIMPLVEKGIAPKATIYSDEARIYQTLNKRGYSHTTVNHSTLEYVRGNVHTNTIEGFWSQLKRSLDGTYHAVSPKYLQSYLNQFVFYYNYRDVAVCPILLELVSKPV